MEVQELKTHLSEIAKVSNAEWMASLNGRKMKELEFHNRHRDKQSKEALDQDTFDKLYSNKKFYSTIRKSTEYVEDWIAENTKGKVFLDYCCGNGVLAIKVARAGALLAIGLDISDISVKNAQKDAKAQGLDNTFFFQADAENTRIPDACIDTIICSGMLHHLDLSYAFPELERILAPQGKILAIEASDYNPIIKLYRKMTPNMRTEWEKSHILSLKDVIFAKRFFNIGKIKYWNIISYAGAYKPSLLPFLEAIDDILIKIPVVKLMAWIFSFEMTKKQSGVERLLNSAYV